MKIFGVEIFKQGQLLVKDQVPEIKAPVSQTKKPALMRQVRDPVFRYRTTRSTGRGAFNPSEYDLAELGRIEDTDSYVRQAFDKKVALMLKEGWDLTGKNLQTLRYLKTRFAQIARASNVPTKSLFRSISSSLIRKSNAFVVKVRNVEASGGRVRSEPDKKVSIKPIAGYFIVPAETMNYQLSGNRITKWRQKMPNGEYKDYSPRDVVHIFYDRKDGFIFGTPTLIPVIDDIRALRKIEENIEMLIYQHLFPLFQYKVGTPEAPAGVTEEGQLEVDIVRREIQFMPSEGGIVTPERHEIKVIGAEGRAMRAEGYLEHFKKRVFSGLGVSAVDFGEGETANRACYSEDTQTLTDSGWKFYWEIMPEDKIATFNLETDNIEFHKPNGDILLYQYQGSMIHFKNRNINVLVTSDHDMWMGRPRNNQGLMWEKIHAEDIDIHQFKFRSGQLGWNGEDEPEDFLLPYVPYKCYSKVPNPGPWSRIEIDLWLQFLGLYISEGTLAKTPDKWAVSISQSSRVNPEKTEFIRNVLKQLPFKFNEYTDPGDGTTRFWINCKSLYLYLEEQCGDYSYRKHLPQKVLSYSRPYLQVLLEALMIGDGTEDKREGRTSRTYYSNSQELVDQVQEIALKIGYRAHVLEGSRCQRVCLSWADVSNVTKAAVETVSYDGMVYCFNVPNHLFITRRNGRIGIHGNTADNMSRNLIDTVKDFQQVIETFINEYILNELLLESTFDSSVLDDENTCAMKFKEIDVDAQIKKENHYADLFEKDVIDHDEARKGLGLEPLEIPTREEIESEEDTALKYPQWHRMRWKLFDEPKLLIQSLDEPWSASARAVAKNSLLELSQSDVEEVGKAKNEQEINLEKERSKAKVAVTKQKPSGGRPTNVGTRPSRPKVKNGYLKEAYLRLTQDVVARVSLEEQLDYNWAAQMIRAELDTTIQRLIAEQILSFRNGYASQAPITPIFANKVSTARGLFTGRANHFVSRLANHVVTSLKRRVKNDIESAEIIRETRAVLDSFRYRTDFIEDVEIRKAYNWGASQGLKTQQVNTIFSVARKEACVTCKSHHAQPIELEHIVIDDVPPYHASCSCALTQNKEMTKLRDATVQDAEGSLPPPSGVKMNDEPADKPLPKTGGHTKCPKCGKTAIKKKDTPDIFNCRACKTSFRVVKGDSLEDTIGPKAKHAAFLKCTVRAKARLRTQHPTWDEGHLDMMADIACDHHLQDSDEEIDEENSNSQGE